MKREARQNRFILVTQRLVAAKRETLQNNLNCLQGGKKEYAFTECQLRLAAL